MVEDNNVIVSLSKIGAIGDDNVKLEKIVEDGKNKNFRKILDYMLDTKEDSLNPAYNPEERNLRDDIQNWKSGAEGGNGAFDLIYLKQNNEYSEPVSLDNYVRDSNDIIREKTRNSEFGEELKYDGIDLVARFEQVGGK